MDLRYMRRCTTLVEAQKIRLPVNETLLPERASSRTSGPMRRMFRDLFGYIRSIQVDVALAQTE
jgi:hypothetical protein